MGKKRKAEAESSETAKRLKQAKSVNYSELPRDQCFVWKLSDDIHVYESFNELMSWLRHWGCLDGAFFHDIPSLTYLHGYPLVQVKVTSPGKKSKKLLFSRASLYILAFYCRRGWMMFDDVELDIAFDDLKFKKMECTAAYTTEDKPWSEIGPKVLLKAFDLMDNENDEIASEGCQAFMVHIAEACRSRIIEFMVASTLNPILPPRRDLEGDEVILIAPPDVEDICASWHPLQIDLNRSIQTPTQTEFIIKKYKQLSKAWYVYSLSNLKLCPLDPDIARQCGIKYVGSLRKCLAVLCNTNLDKVVNEWDTKFKKRACPPSFTLADLQSMKSTVERLKQPREQRQPHL